MTNTLDDLDYLVLQAVANDFEEFEMIAKEITEWTSNNKTAPGIERIQQALMKAIAEGTVKAYEPREGDHQLVATEADPRKVHSLWFYVTEQGKIRMQKLEEEADRT
jgi:hypothetical protein